MMPKTKGATVHMEGMVIFRRRSSGANMHGTGMPNLGRMEMGREEREERKGKRTGILEGLPRNVPFLMFYCLRLLFIVTFTIASFFRSCRDC